MKFIPESTIDQHIDRLSQSQSVNLDDSIQDLATGQPALLSYLSSENIDAFSDAEKDFLFFATLVIVRSIEAELGELPELTADLLMEQEEKNFATMSVAKGRTFRDKITVFFDDYPQEDLLAFVEDALEEDEEGLITQEGREYLFVMLKSVVDAFVV